MLATTSRRLRRRSLSLCPIAGDINTFYEAREGMVTFSNTLTVSEFRLARYGTIRKLYQGRASGCSSGTSAPAWRVTQLIWPGAPGVPILDDDKRRRTGPHLGLPDGNQLSITRAPMAASRWHAKVPTSSVVRHRQRLTGACTGASGGTARARGRIRPTAATPGDPFTVANPVQAAPAVGGSIKAVSMNMLNCLHDH